MAVVEITSHTYFDHIRIKHCTSVKGRAHMHYMNLSESMGKPCSCTKFIKSRIFTTSHVRIHINIASHARIHIRYYKSRALRLNMQ